MARSVWYAASDGRYWLDIVLGRLETEVMIELGLIDPNDQVAFELDPVLFDQLLHRGDMVAGSPRRRRDASGQEVEMATGWLAAQLIDPPTRQRVGPLVPVFALRAPPLVPSRVGVVFFHNLTGCRVDWDLDSRTWCVEYP